MLLVIILLHIYISEGEQKLIWMVFLATLICFVIIHNLKVTSLKKNLEEEIQKNRYTHDRLMVKYQIESMLSKISSMLSFADNLDEKIEESLGMLGELCHADRSYIFRFTGDEHIVNNTHEWCANGVEPQKEILQNLPGSEYQWWLRKLTEEGAVHIKDIEDLPPEADAEKRLLMSQDIKSLITLPFFAENEIAGFIGFDNVRETGEWTNKDIEVLNTYSNILAMAFRKKSIAEDLNLERRQLLSIFDSIEEPVYVSDPYTHEILYVNKFLDQILEKNPIGKKCYQVLQGFSKPCDFCTNSLILKNKNRAHKWEYHNPTNEKDYLIMDRIIKWIDGSDVRLEMAHDITEIKKAQSALMVDESCLETLHELSYMNRFSTDTIRNFALSEGIKLTGSEAGVLGFFDENRKLSSVILQPENILKTHGFTNDDLMCGLESCHRWTELLENKKPLIMNGPSETELARCPDIFRKMRICSYIAAPILYGNKVVGFLTVANKKDDYTKNDARQISLITQTMGGMILLKQSEDELKIYNTKLKDINDELKKANDELHSLDEMKSNFLATMSHELKTPLISIMGFSELVGDEILGPLNKEQKRAMKVVNSNSGQLKRLIESLLFMNTLEAKNYVYEYSEVRIPQIVEKALSLVSMENADKQLTVENRIPDSLPFVSADSNYLSEVFIHLIDNAFKFTPSGGRITITATHEKKGIHVTIEDTGIGIPETKIMKTFDSFYQLDGSLTRRYGGAGIGLNICKRITEDHGGRLWIESIEGAGTKVHVSLPETS